MVNLVLVILSYMIPHTLLETLNSPLNENPDTEKTFTKRERERETGPNVCLHTYFYA